MENKEYLNEETYQKSNQKVKKVGNIIIIVGIIVLALGLIFLLFGLFGFGKQISNGMDMGQEGINASKIFSGIGSVALGGFMLSGGSFLTIVGLIVRFAIGNRREIAAYTTQQVMPVAQEGIEKMAPTIGNVAKEISKGIKEGMKDSEK